MKLDQAAMDAITRSVVESEVRKAQKQIRPKVAAAIRRALDARDFQASIERYVRDFLRSSITEGHPTDWIPDAEWNRVCAKAVRGALNK